MKITAIFLLAAVLQVSAKGWGQERISLSLINASLDQALNAIAGQAQVTFLYRPEYVKGKKVSIEVKNASLVTVLDLCVKKQELSYDVVGKTVIIHPVRKENTVVEAPPLIDVRGRVVNEKGEPVEGVTVTVKGSSKNTSTDKNGEFSLSTVDQDAILVFTHVSLETFELKVSGKTELAISLKTKVAALGDVMVTVNTGYEKIPKERATGSFEFVNKEEINQRVGTDILSRLEGVSSSLYFDRRNQSPGQSGIDKSNIIIRGLSTLSESAKGPLVVVNNFPYDGDLSSLNPNDVESVTVLKDAAAASIWGAKAGNGVIVITTKQGKFNQPFQLSVNGNIQITQMPDLFKFPKMSSSDFIDVEKNLFDQGFYDGDLTDSWFPGLSPVVEILDQERAGVISSTDAKAKIDALRTQDVRNDFSRYIYRRGVNQQYALNMNGGSDKVRYSFSGGYDKGLDNLVGNEFRRITFRSDNSFIPTKKLEVQAGIAFSNIISKQNSPGNIGSPTYDYYYDESRKLYPYAQLADVNGKSLALPHDWRPGYADTAGNGKLLDWSFRPLDELKMADNRLKQNEWILNLSFIYKLTESLSLQGSYQYLQNNSSIINNCSVGTYFTRNLINLFSQVQGDDVVYMLPKGGIVDQFYTERQAQMGRVQINFNRSWIKHQVSAIGGAELRESIENDRSNRIYGFNQSSYTFSSVDYINFYPQYGDRGNSVIPDLTGISRLNDHFVSFYGNANYTYDKRYILSTSLRRDASNLFGVNINDKWKPFWTVGGAWNVSNEAFYHVKQVNHFQLRVTYGRQGNVNNTISPFTILNYEPGSSSPLNIPFATIRVPGNPGLSWETIKQFNIGSDIGAFNNRVTASLNFYKKTSDNLLLSSVIDPTTGISGVVRNSAGILAKGIELELKTVNIDGKFKWITQTGFNQVKNVVTKYLLNDNTRIVNGIVANSGLGITIVKGKSPFGIFSFPFNGLDPNTGDPIGYNGKQISTDYRRISLQRLDTANLVYSGSGVPTIYGIFNNSFSYKGINLDISISYQFHYYFRKSTISYYSLMYNGVAHPDYAKRWQNPGDEKLTTVPSMDYTVSNTYRDDFYAYSAATVLKGDHIRLQYIRLSYTLNNTLLKKTHLKNVQVYGTTENLGIIWRANKDGLDPTYNSGNGIFPPPKKIAVGIKLDL